MKLSMNMRRSAISILVAMLLAIGVQAQQIAFISDPHVEDVVGHPELLRSLDAQVQSTRLFNENIFAFRAALEDVARRGIQLVVLCGDVTDDGQLLNQEAARRMLSDYEQRYGMSFFVTPGNHDPASPFGKHSIRRDFLAADGSEHTIVSDSSLYVEGTDVLPQLFSVGHKEMIECYADFGYMPKEGYIYWTTPFSHYRYEDYSFDRACSESALDRRMFSYADGIKTHDTSYLVEPIPGIWLLSIDSGVYLPDGTSGKFMNSGVGYNNTLQHKPYLIPWIKRVYAEAERLGKHVIAFSHFPLLDCNDGASEVLGRSWGKNKFDIERMPSDEVKNAMMDAGVGLHFAGHMHIKEVEKMERDGKCMYNVQIPSLITAIPAYHILSVKDDGKAHLETVLVDKVDGFDTFFDMYRKEYEYEKSIGKQPIWSIEALDAKDYAEFCDWMFRDLVRTRFSVRDLPPILQEQMLPLDGIQLLKRVNPKAKSVIGMKEWTGADMLLDFYRLHYSGSLALRYITTQRLKQYDMLFKAIEKSREESEFITQMRDFAFAFKCFLNDVDEEDFEL